MAPCVRRKIPDADSLNNSSAQTTLPFSAPYAADEIAVAKKSGSSAESFVPTLLLRLGFRTTSHEPIDHPSQRLGATSVTCGFLRIPTPGRSLGSPQGPPSCAFKCADIEFVRIFERYLASSVMGLVIEDLVDCPTVTFLGHSSRCYGNWLVIDRLRRGRRTVPALLPWY